MSKKQVISFRLSESELKVLDLACHRFSESRSQVISRAIKSLLTEYVDQQGKQIRRPYWLANLDGEYNEGR
jgi:metal-responsive CopG/Arc/MetJ family transcriptional regulator